MDRDGGTTVLRDELHRIADSLPEDATWDDVMEEVYLQKVIEKGLKDVREGRVKPVEEIRRKYGLPD